MGCESEDMGVECMGRGCCCELRNRAGHGDIPRHVHTWLVGPTPCIHNNTSLIYLRQWTYWIAAILTAVTTLLAVFLKESRASKLLETAIKKVARERKDM